MSTMQMNLAFTGWGVVSPIGIGRAAFVEGVRSQRSGLTSKDAAEEPGDASGDAVGRLTDFDVAAILGSKRGTRILDRTAALALAATTLALCDRSSQLQENERDGWGVVLGTSNGSFSRTVEYTMETLSPERPYLVSPEAFPNTVMNFAAGQCAIWHRLRALNATISGGRLACLLALRYASRMLRSGYTDGLVVGSVEEYSDVMAWGARHASAVHGRKQTALGEGGAMFLLEHEARAAEASHARLIACEVAMTRDNDDPSQALARCIRRSLERAGLGPRDVALVSMRRSGIPELDAIEQRGLTVALEGHQPARRLEIARQVGECYSASGALQISAVLASFAFDPVPAGRVALVTSVAHGGGVGCALLGCAS